MEDETSGLLKEYEHISSFEKEETAAGVENRRRGYGMKPPPGLRTGDGIME